MKYIKLFENFLNESSCYICNDCGERAEHEEIEDNPRMKCTNCNSCAWVDEEDYNSSKKGSKSKSKIKPKK
jgi:DNA-directed RNA polymerase subunit RPC12/RpoP